MNSPAYGNHPSGASTTDASITDALTELALDLRWSFNHSADKLWERLDPELWDLTHNPWIVLQTVSRERLQSVTADPRFPMLVVADLHREKRTAEQSEGWFQKAHPQSALSASRLFLHGVHVERGPAHLFGRARKRRWRSAQGGEQSRRSGHRGRSALPTRIFPAGNRRSRVSSKRCIHSMTPVSCRFSRLRKPNGEWLRLSIDFPGAKLWIRTWQVQVGRAKLYLLDTNDPANIPAYRGITSELYGGGPELRLQQEQVLGIGGWRLLRALGLQPEVCHLNEGHAAFAVLERARSYMADNKQPFDLALTITRAGNLFTTHTPVEAGFDRFAPDLMEKYFKRLCGKRTFDLLPGPARSRAARPKRFL